MDLPSSHVGSEALRSTDIDHTLLSISEASVGADIQSLFAASTICNRIRALKQNFDEETQLFDLQGRSKRGVGRDWHFLYSKNFIFMIIPRLDIWIESITSLFSLLKSGLFCY